MVKVRRKPIKLGERPAFFSVHVDSYVIIVEAPESSQYWDMFIMLCMNRFYLIPGPT